MISSALYQQHNVSLDRFTTLFNSCNPDSNLIMMRNPTENYQHDGLIISFNTGETLGYDWTQRQKGVFNGKRYKYDTFFILERRFKIQSSSLYIETDKEENHVLVAWRDDFIDSKPQTIFINRAGGEKEQALVRFTADFKVYSMTYDDIADLKRTIQQKLNNQHKRR